MSDPSKITGDKKYYQGAAKETLGQALGNEKMRAEGQAQKLEGEGEYKAAQAKTQAEGYKDKVTGNVKETTGGFIGNQQMQAEGTARKNVGDAKHKTNQ